MTGNDLSLAAWKRVSELLPTELQGYAREWGQAVEHLERDRGDSAAHLEWELWRSLCAALEESGAVTRADLKTSIRAPATTPGLRLIRALQAWGIARAAIARASVHNRGDSTEAKP